MKKIAIALLLAACAADDKPPAGFVEASCGAPPQEPGFSMETTTDGSGSPIVIVPEDQFDGLLAWIAAEQGWVTCALDLK